MAATDEPVINQVRQALDRSRGSWAQVSLSSGVPYHTITKIAQRRVTNPRVDTCQRLLDYFRASAGPDAVPQAPST
jgi:hypothetical protein